MYAHAVAHMLTVFKDQWCAPIQQAGSKNRRYTGVRIRECLARTVDIEVPQCDYRKSVGSAVQQADFFLVFLRKGINRSTLKRFCLTRRKRSELGSTFRTQYLPTFIQ